MGWGFQWMRMGITRGRGGGWERKMSEEFGEDRENDAINIFRQLNAMLVWWNGASPPSIPVRERYSSFQLHGTKSGVCSWICLIIMSMYIAEVWLRVWICIIQRTVHRYNNQMCVFAGVSAKGESGGSPITLKLKSAMHLLFFWGGGGNFIFDYSGIIWKIC